MEKTAFLSVGWTLLSLLFAGNLFFIKRLVEKIDKTTSTAYVAANEVKTLQGSVDGVANQLREIKSDIKELRNVQIEVAVIKDRLGLKRQDKDSG